MSRAALPPRVAWLGYGGLLPFAAAALGTLFDDSHRLFWQHALLTYGALILGFVGALHWAYAMQEDDPTAAGTLYAWSVVPALAGWLALLLPMVTVQGFALAALVLIAAFVAHYAQDKRLARRRALPAWYLPLRLHLSSGACLCLAALPLAPALP
jgi:FtsH-binding integral membrane protein